MADSGERGRVVVVEADVRPIKQSKDPRLGWTSLPRGFQLLEGLRFQSLHAQRGH